MTNSEIQARLRDTIALLEVPGVGRGRFNRLVKHFGSPSAVLSASLNSLTEVPGISRTTASAILKKTDPDKAGQISARVIQLGWAVLFPESSAYPKILSRIPDYPPVLFRLGRPWTADDRMIAIVGTRHASEGGCRFAHQLASDLSRAGIIVVSGMAEGIDSAAHRGALEAEGKTVAVWGTPLNQVYPASNRALADEISRQGTIYSEYFPGVESRATNFPERNRIIAGLCEGVVVVEAGQKSGALITAECALEQGRELFAVPGSPTARRSIGTNRLIKDGARLLTETQDIFDELPRLNGTVKVKAFKQSSDLTDMEKRMMGLLEAGPVQIDQLSRQIELPISELMEYLLALELKGIIQELSGKRFVLAQQ